MKAKPMTKRIPADKTPTCIDRIIGTRIRIARHAKPLPQERLAAMLGISFQQLQKYEKGINRISAGRLFEIASLLGYPVAWFYEPEPADDATSHKSATLADKIALLADCEQSNAIERIVDAMLQTAPAPRVAAG